MSSGTVVQYRIDAEDRLTEVNDAWAAFAAANGGDALQPSQVVGRRLWDFLADPTTRALYRAMLVRLRRDGPPIRFGFRCDAANVRRFLSMEMTAEPGGGVLFSLTSIATEPRTSVTLLELGHAHSMAMITACGWCNQIRLPSGEWVEVEAAVMTLGLFGGGPLPDLSHGICTECESVLTAALDAPGMMETGTVSVGGTHRSVP